jgi:hypothetical protein
MHPDSFTLGQLLSMAALLAATCEYAEIIRRRQLARVLIRQEAEVARSGLQGLVRVFLADGGDDQRSGAG